MLNLAAIVGPTAVGKTSISLQVARKLKGEIISCDSMQIYKGMDIGTAKANFKERQEVQHHLIDIIDIDEDFSVANYQQMAQDTIQTLNNEGKLPILVGGTGLYFQAVVDNYEFMPMHTRFAVRNKWHELIEQKGLEFAYQQLLQVDRQYAGIISPSDRKRITRALEVYDLTGMTFFSLQKKNQNTYNIAIVGLYLDRNELYFRIDKRVEEMFNQGWVNEVLNLRQQGCGIAYNALQALGYKHILYYLDGYLTWKDMITEIQRETRRYAKRQLTWFRKDRRICWYNIKDYPDEKALAENISLYLEGQLFDT